MPIDYTTEEKAALEGPFCSFAGLVRVATPIPVYLWTGLGDLPVTGSAFDPDGTIYIGSRLIDLPQFTRIWNGLAERVTITFTGVTDDMRAIAYVEADDIRGAVVRMGITVIEGFTQQQIGPVRWLRRGRVDVIETHNRPGERERIKTIAFSLGSQLTGRKVPGSGVYTNADQQSRPGSEDDRFCERTPLMTQNLVMRWPD